MTRPTTLARLMGGLGAATLATGLALAAPMAYAHGGHDSGGGSGSGSGDDSGDDHGHDTALTHLNLPNGFQPEGIATGSHDTAYLGSLADGDIYALDLHSGTGEVLSQGPGTPSAGLKVDHDLLFVAGGSAGDARVIDLRSGDVLATYQLVAAGTTGFVNDVVVTHDAAWFTDSFDNALYRLPLGDDHGDDDGSHHGDHHGGTGGEHGVAHQRHGSHHSHHHGHHGHHGHRNHTLPTQADVQKIDLTGAWVQGTGFNANGIATTPDGKALLVVNSSNGLLYRVTEDGVATQVDLGGAVLTNGDGLLRDDDTLYVVQNQLNKVAVIDLDRTGSSGEITDTLTSPDFDVPTAIARSDGNLYLPNARFSTTPTPTTPYWVTAIGDPEDD